MLRRRNSNSEYNLPTTDSAVEEQPVEKKSTSRMGMPSMSVIVMVVLGAAVIMLLNSKRAITSKIIEEREIHQRDIEEKEAAYLRATKDNENLRTAIKELGIQKSQMVSEKDKCFEELSRASEKAALVDIKHSELEQKANELAAVKGEIEGLRQRESQAVQEKEAAFQALNAEREKVAQTSAALQNSANQAATLEAQLREEQGKVANLQTEYANLQQAATQAQQQAQAAQQQLQQAQQQAQQAQQAPPAA